MSDCQFNIPFTGTPESVIQKARAAVEGQGGRFEGSTDAGSFEVSVFGNSLAGSYKTTGQQLEIIIHSKPFIIPCSAIESFLTKQIS
jgi:hypothetical protein